MNIALISKIKYLEYNSLYFGFFFFFNYIELLRKPILYNSTPALSLKMIVKNNFQKFEYHNQIYIEVQDPQENIDQILFIPTSSITRI